MLGDVLPRLCPRCAHFAADACAPRRGVPPCAAPASRCLTIEGVGAARDHHVACSRGERGLHAIRAASHRWVLTLAEWLSHRVQSGKHAILGDDSRCRCAQPHLDGSRDPICAQRRRMTCVAAPRAAVPNTTCAGSAVATVPFIASGVFMLLPGWPCAGGLACAAARALRLADAGTLRQAGACVRRGSCA